MKITAVAVVAAGLAAFPALARDLHLAQADGNRAPGAVVDGGAAPLNAAEGTGPDGQPLPAEGHRAATSGSGMVKRDATGGGRAGHAGPPGQP